MEWSTSSFTGRSLRRRSPSSWCWREPICYFLLPVAQFPDITPPQVVVSAIYPGASAQVVADTVTTPLEQQINGVQGMTYMSSVEFQ